MSLKYSLVSVGGEQAVTVFSGGEVYTAQSESHPNWATILQKVLAGDESVVDDFDTARVLQRYFEPVSERVSVANGRLYFDGDEVHEALSRQAVRAYESGETEKFSRLVLFLENVMNNPSEHSREQLYEWLLRKDFGIDAEGRIVGYKSVYTVSGTEGGVFRPTRNGPGIVDGVEVTNGYLEQRVGSVVEMARSQVVHDPSVGCSVGLHVSNYDYAEGFSGDTILRVAVNPRDVVSVPTECDWDKMRVSRYVVVEATPKSEYTYNAEEVFYGEDYEACDECGEDVDECACYEDEETQEFDAREVAGSNYRYNHRGADGKFTKRL